MRRVIQQRTRFFVAVEGESEQSFVAWIQSLAGDKNIAIHLDVIVLGGGGYRSMLEHAVAELRKRSRTKGAYKHRFLIVDEDRTGSGDWPAEDLRKEAAKHEIVVCMERPNFEGLLYRLTRGHEREFVQAGVADTKLKAQWATYDKPTNAQKLRSRFSLDDLLRAADIDPDLSFFLRAVGLIH